LPHQLRDKIGQIALTNFITYSFSLANQQIDTMKTIIKNLLLGALLLLPITTYGNTAPKISDIAAQSISKGSSTKALAFTISDAQTAASALKLSASSSNTKLVPKSNIVFGGSGKNRTVRVTPIRSGTGKATITVTVSDGKLSRRDTFVLTVTGNTAPTNTPPAISDIAAQTIDAEAYTGGIAFTISDAQTPASSLTLSKSSNNTTLVPNSNIFFGGSGANRTVMVVPASGQIGTATITVTVSDGKLSRSDTFLLTVRNTAPTISDIAAQTIAAGANTGAIAFTISDAQTPASSLVLSKSSSNTTLVPNSNIVFGGSGANRTVTVTPASGQTGTATITVTVSDGSLTGSDSFLLTVNSAVPADMALIPAGDFTMGNSVLADTDITDAPTRTVTLDAFYMGKYEVTKAEWDEVRSWGLNNGYTDLAAGSGKANNHPVQGVTWYQFVKWCNARSEREGLTPVYYTDNAQTTIYKTGNVNVTNAQVKWTANGYRLPTEAEWEKAARGGLTGKRFPWGDTISHSKSNYFAWNTYTYDWSGIVKGYHPSFKYGNTPYTSPVGSFEANGYGLYDMTGNVWEWCWDWYGAYSSGSQTNPLGANSGANRIIRGGSWDRGPGACRIAKRYYSNPSSTIDSNLADSAGLGIRLARSISSAPNGFAMIPAGSFTMGNSMGEDTDITDAPTRTVTLDAFYIGKFEVTKAEWDEVQSWGLINGYTDLVAGAGKASNHPVHSISWYQMVKWCNARSEKEGLTPAYYTNDAQSTIYKTGNVGITNSQVKWNANGYRLPTEAEWEKAARGGLNGKRFPWGDTISHNQANYYAGTFTYTGDTTPYHDDYDLSYQQKIFHPSYSSGSQPYTSPVGSFVANGFGLHDMAGNAYEYCWDRYGAYASGDQTNPRGPTSGDSYDSRVARGGSWYDYAYQNRVAYRTGGNPSYTNPTPVGFRVLRGSAP
jgi:formylglycine-generating enzyme required for sulfatase activity